MKVFKKKEELADYLLSQKDHSIGFVPTMGSLHKGHISLILQSKKKCSITVCSIFINPTQFNDINDFKKYPTNLTADLKLLETANCDVAYTPSHDDLYNKNEVAQNYEFNGLENHLEGKHRPGHFNGVATIIEKLFKLVKPNYAFFGEKDLQQLVIIKSLVKNIGVKVIITGCPTTRNKNGLALSSRNILLSKEDLLYSSIIYKQLLLFKKNYLNTSIIELKNSIIKNLTKSKKIEIDYFEFIEIATLQPILVINKETKYAACIAVKISGVRLIDNIIL
jgi:pantoate--beta-alanine ligase